MEIAVERVPGSTAHRSFAEVWGALGRVPLDRILMQPPPGAANEEDVLARPGGLKRVCELVEGVLIAKTADIRDSVFTANLIAQLIGRIDGEHGVVLGPNGPFRLRPGLVYVPDASFVSWSRLPDAKVPSRFVDGAPDLVIEVIDAYNTPGEMDRKLRDYFSAGASLVWHIFPNARTAVSYTSPTTSTEHHVNKPLDGSAVVPGLQLPLLPLFKGVDYRPSYT